MQTTDSGLLFQTTRDVQDESRRDRKRKAAELLGKPLAVGKVIDFIINDSTLYTAESGWVARRVDLSVSKSTRLYKGHQGPVTCVALRQTPERHHLFTGSWDKTIRIWDADTGEHVETLTGHVDFVKSLLVLPGHLLSTSSDRTIKVWKLGSGNSDSRSECVQTVKEHARPVDQSTFTIEDDRVTVWTADSMGVINEWHFLDGTLHLIRRITQHETSVTDLSPIDGGMWSVSMDKTARLHLDPPASFTHSAPFHCILPIPSDLSARNLVITGGDDEDLVVWEDRGDGFTMIAKAEGHCHVISRLRVWRPMGKTALIVSAGLDGTIRRWTLEDLLHPKPLLYGNEEHVVQMTAEEEQELLELMEE